MDLILEGPEDDSIGAETRCPIKSNIIIKFVVFDYNLYMYVNTSGWLTLKMSSTAVLLSTTSEADNL
jgi:hypothetical protein